MLLTVILLSLASVLLNIGVIVLRQRIAAMREEIKMLKSCVSATSANHLPKLESPDGEELNNPRDCCRQSLFI